MNILITGGAGYIGTNLTIALSSLKEVSSITIYDNLSRKVFGLFNSSIIENPEKINFIKGDILDSKKLKEAMKNVDVLFHLAASTGTPFANIDIHRFEQVNHWGTAELCYAAENADIKDFVYISSAAVYGFSDKPKGELDPANPGTAYAISKFNGEKLFSRLDNLNRGKTIILRCGNVYGQSPSIRFDSVINRFAFESRYKNKIYIEGDGTQKRPFIFIDNLIDSITCIINNNNINTGTYNLFDNNLSINEIANIFKNIYPGLETQYLSRHVKRESLELLESGMLTKAPNNFNTNIQLFSESFSF